MNRFDPKIWGETPIMVIFSEGKYVRYADHQVRVQQLIDDCDNASNQRDIIEGHLNNALQNVNRLDKEFHNMKTAYMMEKVFSNQANVQIRDLNARIENILGREETLTERCMTAELDRDWYLADRENLISALIREGRTLEDIKHMARPDGRKGV